MFFSNSPEFSSQILHYTMNIFFSSSDRKSRLPLEHRALAGVLPPYLSWCFTIVSQLVFYYYCLVFYMGLDVKSKTDLILESPFAFLRKLTSLAPVTARLCSRIRTHTALP